jgi:diguanylate cyclase (GGDEF)-like protein
VVIRLVGRRAVARAAIACLTLGMAGLALLAVQTNSRTSQTTVRIRAMEEVSDRWDELFLDVGVEYEALSDYQRADSAQGRAPLSSALHSAVPSLDWLRQNAGPVEAARARMIGNSYDAYTVSLKQVIAAGDRGDTAAVAISAEQASLSASALRKQAVANAARQRQTLLLFLDDAEQSNDAYRVATLGLAAADCLLLVLCGLILLSYQRHAEEQNEQSTHRALHDGLTGIGNRTLFTDRLEWSIQAAKRTGTEVGLLLLDLDRFKEINDTLGHQQGDALLCEVAARLDTTVRAEDTVARLGGDEFAVLLHGTTSDDEAIQVAHRVLEAVRQPITLDGVTTDVGCSIGVAIYPVHGTNPSDLFKNADIAMYVAKRGHLGASVYSPEMDHHSSDRLAILAGLRRAIDNHELVLHYQPQIDTTTSVVCGVEALVRWEHPTRGLLPPGEFIPAAERSDLMKPLTDYVLATALQQQQDWIATGLTLPISVNIGAASLLDSTFPDQIAAQLTAFAVPAELVTLEITETAFIADETRAVAVIERLRQIGTPLALDDFGTGYASMTYLKRLPLSELKIDRSFVTDMLHADQNHVIARALIDMAHSLGLRVVAKGVEDHQTLQALAGLGCEHAQGYHICKPVPITQLMTWLADQEPDFVSRTPVLRR